MRCISWRGDKVNVSSAPSLATTARLFWFLLWHTWYHLLHNGRKASLQAHDDWSTFSARPTFSWRESESQSSAPRWVDSQCFFQSVLLYIRYLVISIVHDEQARSRRAIDSNWPISSFANFVVVDSTVGQARLRAHHNWATLRYSSKRVHSPDR